MTERSEQRSTTSSTSSKRRNSNLRKLLNEIKSGEMQSQTSLAQDCYARQNSASKPPVAANGAKTTTDVTLDSDLLELRKRIAGLESKINQDSLTSNAGPAQPSTEIAQRQQHYD